jgi:hypothetical protein
MIHSLVAIALSAGVAQPMFATDGLWTVMVDQGMSQVWRDNKLHAAGRAPACLTLAHDQGFSCLTGERLWHFDPQKEVWRPGERTRYNERVSQPAQGDLPRLFRSGELESREKRLIGRAWPGAVDRDLSPNGSLLATVHQGLSGVYPAVLQIHSWPQFTPLVTMAFTDLETPTGVVFLDGLTLIVRDADGWGRRYALFSAAQPIPLAIGDLVVGDGVWTTTDSAVWVATEHGVLELGPNGQVVHEGDVVGVGAHPDGGVRVFASSGQVGRQLPTHPQSGAELIDGALLREALAGRLAQTSRPLYSWTWGFRQWDLRDRDALLDHLARGMDELENSWQRGGWRLAFHLQELEPALRKAALYDPLHPRVDVARDRYAELDSLRRLGLEQLTDLGLCLLVVLAIIGRLITRPRPTPLAVDSWARRPEDTVACESGWQSESHLA